MSQRHLSSASGAPLCRGHETDEHQPYYYPPIHRPSTAHISIGKPCYEGQATDNARLNGSISSGSGSSGISQHKRQARSGSHSPPWPSPTLVQTAVSNHTNNHRRQSSSYQPPFPGVAHSHKVSQTGQTNSPALAYVRERRQIEEDDDEEEEHDHALWVWVGYILPQHSSHIY